MKIKQRISFNNCEHLEGYIDLELKPSKIDKKWNVKRMKYLFSIIRNAITVSFQFWGSAHDFRENQHPDPTEALECIVNDADCVVWEGFSTDWMSDYGYDDDDKGISKAKKAYKACEQSLEKWRTLGFNDDDLQFVRDLIQNDEVMNSPIKIEGKTH